VDDISQNDSASVSAMSVGVVISLLQSCRCLISVKDHFPEILLIMFQTRLRVVRLFIEETKVLPQLTSCASDCYSWLGKDDFEMLAIFRERLRFNFP